MTILNNWIILCKIAMAYHDTFSIVKLIIYIEQIESDRFDWKSIKLAVIGKISFISKHFSRYLQCK